MLLFHSGNLPHYGLERIFELAKQAGFEGIEVEINEIFDTQSPVYLKKLEKRYDLPIKAFSLKSGKEESLFEAFQKTVREFKGVRLNLNPPRSFGAKYRKWITNVVPRLAQKYGLEFCRKNVPVQTIFGLIPKYNENSLAALRETPRVCMDLSALAMSGQEVMRIIPLFGEKLRHVYLSNYHQGIPYSSLEKGILPLESFLTKLAKIKYKGDFTLRLSPAALGEGDDNQILESMKGGIGFLGKYFG